MWCVLGDSEDNGPQTWGPFHTRSEAVHFKKWAKHDCWEKLSVQYLVNPYQFISEWDLREEIKAGSN